MTIYYIVVIGVSVIGFSISSWMLIRDLYIDYQWNRWKYKSGRDQ